jgi:hypothetical protein
MKKRVSLIVLASLGCCLIALPALAAAAKSAADCYKQGKACFDKEDYDAAIAAYTEAIRIDPKSAARGSVSIAGTNPTGSRRETEPMRASGPPPRSVHNTSPTRQRGEADASPRCHQAKLDA